AHDREAEVQGDRHRTQHRHREADAETGRNAIVLDLHRSLHRARVDETHQVQVVARGHRQLILQTVEQQEVAAYLEAVDVRSDAAELEATQTAEAARVE